MTPPQRNIPGATYLVTRRCCQRRFLMKASRVVRHVLAFSLAKYTQDHGIELHAFAFLSDHYHLVLTDPRARISDFLRDFNGQSARLLNRHRNRGDYFWDSQRVSRVLLGGAGDTFDKIIYVLTNAMRSCLVDASWKWLGLRSRPRDMLRPALRIPRPEGFFTKRSKVPPCALLKITKPPGFEDYSVEAYVELLEQRLREEEEELCQKARESGKGFLGREKARAVSPEDRPSTPDRRGKLSPRVACRDPSLRALLLDQLKAFWRAYREARARYKAGDFNTLFPYGTYWLRVHLGVRCAQAPP